MTHVTNNTHSNISSSHNEKQPGKFDSQTETLFDSLFSIVSKLDTESVELIKSKLSGESSPNQHLSLDAEKISLEKRSAVPNSKMSGFQKRAKRILFELNIK